MKISAVYYEQSVAIRVTFQAALLYVNYGEGELMVDGESTIAIIPQRVFLVNGDTEIVLASGELAGYLVEFAMLALEHFLAKSVGHRNKGIFDRSSLVPHVDLIKDEVHFLKSILAQLTTKIELRSSYALLEQYFFMLLVHLNLHAEYTTNFDKKLANLALEIAMLIDANFIYHRKISFYAKQLDITERELNERCKSIYCMRFGQVMLEKICYEADRLLADIDMPIKNIAWELGYEEYGHFNTMYARHRGYTPAEYRKMLGQG